MFLTYYIAYTTLIVIEETHPQIADAAVVIMFGGGIPLTIITLMTGVVRYIRNGARNDVSYPEERDQLPLIP